MKHILAILATVFLGGSLLGLGVAPTPTRKPIPVRQAPQTAPSQHETLKDGLASNEPVGQDKVDLVQKKDLYFTTYAGCRPCAIFKRQYAKDEALQKEIKDHWNFLEVHPNDIGLTRAPKAVVNGEVYSFKWQSGSTSKLNLSDFLAWLKSKR